MSRPSLMITSGPLAGSHLPLDRELWIGRAHSGAGSLGGDEELSRNHARVSVDHSGRVIIEDLASTNGTFVNGLRVTGPRVLVPGDRIEVGTTRLELEQERREPAPPPARAEEPTAPQPPAAAAAPKPPPPIGSPSVIRAGLPGSMKGRIFPSVGLLVVQLIVGYEWLMSAFTKIFKGGFPEGLGAELTEKSKDAAGWYRDFLKAVIIPNHTLFGYLIEFSELIVGVVLISTGLLWMFRWEQLRRRGRDYVLLGTAAASLAGIFMNVQFYLSSGDPPPFFLAKDAFDEGIGLDVVLPLLEAVLCGVALWTWWSLRRARTKPRITGGPVRRVVIAGGGFGGLSAAKALERELPENAQLTLISDANFLLYTPLLPGAAASALEPSSVVVPLRDQLRRAEVRVARIVGGDPSHGTIEVEPLGRPPRPGAAAPSAGEREFVPYDQLIVALGSVSRTLRIPGLAEHAIGVKTLPEAVALRNWVITTLETAEAQATDEARTPYLTYVFAGAGYAGLETIAELHDFAERAVVRYPRCRAHGLQWLLVQSGNRVMPEVDGRLAAYAARKLTSRGIQILTGLRLGSVDGDGATLSSGDRIPTHTVIWTAGVQAHPVVGRMGLPLDAGGRIVVDDWMRVAGLENVWALGDAAAVPDPGRLDGRPCPMTAQHAIRQGRVVAENVAAALGSGRPRPFTYRSLGVFVDLGRRTGVAKVLGIPVRGFPAWLLARLYHAGRMPGLRRKFRLIADWGIDVVQGRDTADLGQVGHPRSLLGQLEDQSVGGTSGIHMRPPGLS